MRVTLVHHAEFYASPFDERRSVAAAAEQTHERRQSQVLDGISCAVVVDAPLALPEPIDLWPRCETRCPAQSIMCNEWKLNFILLCTMRIVYESSTTITLAITIKSKMNCCPKPDRERATKSQSRLHTPQQKKCQRQSSNSNGFESISLLSAAHTPQGNPQSVRFVPHKREIDTHSICAVIRIFQHLVWSHLDNLARTSRARLNCSSRNECW